MSEPTETGVPRKSEKADGGHLYDRKTATAAKAESHYIDPCQEAADQSLRCLRRNGGDRNMCQTFFTSYRECKERWMEEMKEIKRLQRRQAAEGWMNWLTGK